LNPIILTESQINIAHGSLDNKTFLEGPAGTGKTTTGVERLKVLLASDVPGDSILILVPQRIVAEPYSTFLHHPDCRAGGMVSVYTMGGIAQRMVELFWPIVAEQAGFANPDEAPRFLTLETAQYYMAHVMRKYLDEGYFESLTIDRNRLYSQILDNINKASIVGFPIEKISERLKSAWMGEPVQLRIYEDVQACIDEFRKFCLDNNLLDYSLQMEVFSQFLWSSAETRSYLFNTYKHLIYDNLEEDNPIAHDLVREWFPNFESVTLIYDQDAGYRYFLGADPQSAFRLKELCGQKITFEESLVSSKAIGSLGAHLSHSIFGRLSAGDYPVTLSKYQSLSDSNQQSSESIHPPLEYKFHRYFTEMLDWVVDGVEDLIKVENVPAREIVILAPFLSGALRFSLVERLSDRGILTRSHRPSRTLREEPAAQCLLVLAALGHPDWGITPTKFDVVYALVQAIQGMDLVRAQLLTEIVYRLRDGIPSLSSFDLIRSEMQERITYHLGGQYEKLRLWLEDSQEYPDELDHFLSRLFGELLSQPGFGFHGSFENGQIIANLIESIQKFRWVAGASLSESGYPLGKEYLLMVQEGLIAAQYLLSWRPQEEDAVFMAPAYTFLMRNRPVDVQFWLDVNSRGWFERLYQPLTHPYVLSRSWKDGNSWTDTEEIVAGQERLRRLVLGLTRRCRRRIYLGLSELGEQGYEQRGPLLFGFQRLIREGYFSNE